MPTAEEILAGLEAIANDWRWLSIFWHGYFAVFIALLIFGLRPSRVVVGIILMMPLFCVSALAWLHGNPFNGLFFSIVAAVLLVVALRLPSGAVDIADPWPVVAGLLMTGFGWVYPHFFPASGVIDYLYLAPAGLIPCPTLSIVIGLSLILSGLDSRAWCLTLAVSGLFYGVFGAMRLGVAIDWTLVAGAAVIIYVGLRRLNGVRA